MDAPATMSARSQVLSILPLNGTEFSPEGKVIIEVQPDLGLIKAARGETYLAVDVLNDSTDNYRWMFPTSGQALIERVDVFSMATGQQLESLQNYNQMMWILDQYTKLNHEMEKSTEGMKEPPYSWEGDVAALVHSDGTPDFVYNSVVSPIKTDGVKAYQAVKMCIPLKLGLFSCFQEEKLTPIISMGGLRIEITLEKKALTCVPIAPLVSSAAQSWAAVVADADLVASGAVGFSVVQGGGGTSEISIANCTIESSGLAVGNKLSVVATGLAKQAITITGMAETGGACVLTVTPASDLSGGGGATGRAAILESQWNPSYKIDSIELRTVQMVVPPQVLDKLGQAMQYKFRSWDLFFDSIPAASRRHQTEITSVASMAKCIMVHYMDSQLEEEPNMPHYWIGERPSDLNLNSQQFFINNKLYPLRDYNPARHEDRPQQLNELQKSFSAMGSPAVSFGDAGGERLDYYVNTFLSTRELARGSYVYSLRDAEPQLRMGFSAGRTNVVRVNSFVWSDKMIDISAQGLTVVL